MGAVSVPEERVKEDRKVEGTRRRDRRRRWLRREGGAARTDDECYKGRGGLKEV